MSQWKIEKDIPMPRKYNSGVPYPFDEMEIGDSFFIACEEADAHKRQSSVQQRAKRHPNMQFSTRLVEGGVRVWRIK